jgi:hypothetical protein
VPRKAAIQESEKGEKNLLRSGTGEAGQIPKKGKDLQWACRIEG